MPHSTSCSTLCIHNYSASTKLSTNLLLSPVVLLSTHTHAVYTKISGSARFDEVLMYSNKTNLMVCSYKTSTKREMEGERAEEKQRKYTNKDGVRL